MPGIVSSAGSSSAGIDGRERAIAAAETPNAAGPIEASITCDCAGAPTEATEPIEATESRISAEDWIEAAGRRSAGRDATATGQLCVNGHSPLASSAAIVPIASAQKPSFEFVLWTA